MSNTAMPQLVAPVVMKFGGTSVRDADAMRRVVSIVERERGNTPVVVTSACAGVTDMLLECARRCGRSERDGALEIVATLHERHLGILDDLCSSDDRSRFALTGLLEEIEQLVHGVLLLGELTGRTLDAFASYGERLSSVLLAEAFAVDGWRASLADSRRFIITDDNFVNARPLMAEIDRRVPSEFAPLLAEFEVVVAQGFIGSTLDGVTTTIGRGGSDHTGALVGAALGATDIQIWTDVSGILTADPRLVPAARVVSEVTFSEARELAYFGAKVIHPDTILPAVERDIPVIIKNSMRPNDPGTRIVSDGAPIQPGIHSITMKRDMVCLTLSPRRQFDPEHSVERSLSIFAAHDVSVHCAITAESRAMVVVSRSSFNDILLADLEATCRVEIASNLALLCMTGSALRATPAVLSNPLSALEGIPISFIAAGSSDNTVLLGMHDEQAIEALTAVHRRLFEHEEMAVE
jgi:aspartate kinase